MVVPSPSSAGRRQREERDEQGNLGALVEHCCCGFCSLLVAAGVVAVGYPLLLSLLQPLDLLSATTPVFVLLVLWSAAWLVLELLWAW